MSSLSSFVPRDEQVNPPRPLLDPAPLLVLHEVPAEAPELAALAPAPFGELEGRDGLLHGTVPDPVGGTCGNCGTCGTVGLVCVRAVWAVAVAIGQSVCVRAVWAA